VRLGPVEAIPKTLERQAQWIALTFKAFGAMALGKLKMKEAVTGPIGLVYLTSDAVKNGIAPLLFLMSLFSLSLAIFNLFPIPILDGGHLFFLLLEKLRGAPVSLIIQERAAQVSLVLLISFALLVCVNDINRYGLMQKMVEWVKP
jgi:regulator of sigma E protease